MAVSKEDVINQIRKAFSGVKRSPDEELLHFPNTGGELWIESFLGDTETDWLDVSPAKIEKEYAALTVFSPYAFAYYLPAYMTWVLNNCTTSASNTVDHTLYDLDLTDREDDVRRIMEDRFSVLSVEQGKAVLAFLKYMSGISKVDSEAALRAIASYWNRFDET
jgi:uncharacterized protein DUF6714